jgi:isoleucyl-tRNA synthetase
MLRVREAVSKELEKLRVAGGIGASLEAEVDLYCEERWSQDLKRLGDELRFLFIVSEARVYPVLDRPDVAMPASGVEGIWIAVQPSAYAKCERCWHRREDVGRVTGHPTICGRCVQNVDGSGEQRHHV